MPLGYAFGFADLPTSKVTAAGGKPRRGQVSLDAFGFCHQAALRGHGHGEETRRRLELIQNLLAHLLVLLIRDSALFLELLQLLQAVR